MNVATGWGGGGGHGSTGVGGADGEGAGLATLVWGATARLGSAIVGGGQQWGCLQPLRTTLHTISISLPKSLSRNGAERL